MYFTAEHAKREASLITDAEFRPFNSSWGHCACTPSAPAPGFMTFLDTAISDLLKM
jgi:homoserine O-acetyltransferase